jgi:hypothetical protein
VTVEKSGGLTLAKDGTLRGRDGVALPIKSAHRIRLVTRSKERANEHGTFRIRSGRTSESKPLNLVSIGPDNRSAG